MDDLALYLEEQRQRDIANALQIKELVTKMQSFIDMYKPPVDTVKIDGALQVNTQKIVEVENLELIKDWLESFAKSLSDSADRNKITIPTQFKISNIDEARVDSVTIKNMESFVDAVAKAVEPFVDAVKSMETIVNVEKQDIKFPKSPKDAIPVRLSDGKSFYNAIMSAINGSRPVEDPLAGYQITDQSQTGTTKYYGFARTDGSWYIMRDQNGTTYRYFKGTPQSGGGGLYSDAWTDRANLQYDYIYEVF